MQETQEKRKIVYVDLDSVLNDLIFQWCNWISIQEKRPFSTNDITEYHDPILQKHIEFIWKSDLYKDFVQPFFGSYEFIETLKTKYNVVICVLSLCSAYY